MFPTGLKTTVLALSLMASQASAQEVEIYLVDMLDNIQSGYCIDIAGGREADADPKDGLQAHTCYSPGGKLGVDQTFSTETFAENQLYMTKFDVCAQAESLEAGSPISLHTCDNSLTQSFDFSATGQILPSSDTSLCVTAGEGTRFGRSKRNQIKSLSLQPCAPENASLQTWAARSSL